MAVSAGDNIDVALPHWRSLRGSLPTSDLSEQDPVVLRKQFIQYINLNI